MAKHKFAYRKDGGYFYRYYPKITTYRESTKESLQREFVFAPPNSNSATPNQLPFLYGKFLCKYHDKELIVELEQRGELILHDEYSGEIESRTLSSILLIAVPNEIYQYPFEDDHVYTISDKGVTELKPEP